MKGMIGCSNTRDCSNTHANVVCVSDLPSFPLECSPFKIGLDSSKYRSQTLPQTNVYSADAASLKRYALSAASTATRTWPTWPKIHLFKASFGAGIVSVR